MTILKKVSVAGISVGVLLSIGIINANVVNASNMPTPISINYDIKEFKDLPRTHWSHASVHWGVERSLVSGYTDGTYKPSAPITEEEFVRVLASFVKLDVKETEYWSQGYYDSLNKYALPIKGHSDKVAKKTHLSRGQIARIIAAKNGFNLDERQAVYYMYENAISYGLVDNKMSFESYGADKTVERAQIPAFFKRIDEQGHTTFMGKDSPVKDGTGIGGIDGVPKDGTVVTDEDFKKLEKDKLGDTLPEGKFPEFESVAKKHGMTLDNGTTGFDIRDDNAPSGTKVKISYKAGNGDNFDISMGNYKKDKALLGDVLKQTGKFTDAEIKEVYNIIENKHGIKDSSYVNSPDTYQIGGKTYVNTSGRLDGTGAGGLQLQFKIIK